MCRGSQCSDVVAAINNDLLGDVIVLCFTRHRPEDCCKCEGRVLDELIMSFWQILSEDTESVTFKIIVTNFNNQHKQSTKSGGGIGTLHLKLGVD